MKVIDWPTLDGLIQNLAFLVAGVTAIVFTYPAGHRQDTPGALALRYVLTVTLGIYLTFKGIVFPGDLRFDFRSVVVAIVARRYGAGPALLVALPIAGFRLGLGSGVGAWLGILQMTVVALVGATGTGWWRLHAPFMLTTTLNLTGLTPGKTYAAHYHAFGPDSATDPCASNGPVSVGFPSFTADAAGRATVSVTSDPAKTAGNLGAYINVHYGDDLQVIPLCASIRTSRT